MPETLEVPEAQVDVFAEVEAATAALELKPQADYYRLVVDTASGKADPTKAPAILVDAGKMTADWRSDVAKFKTNQRMAAELKSLPKLKAAQDKAKADLDFANAEYNRVEKELSAKCKAAFEAHSKAAGDVNRVRDMRSKLLGELMDPTHRRRANELRQKGQRIMSLIADAEQRCRDAGLQPTPIHLREHRGFGERLNKPGLLDKLRASVKSLTQTAQKHPRKKAEAELHAAERWHRAQPFVEKLESLHAELSAVNAESEKLSDSIFNL